jgi:hypothetical protein
MVVYYELSHYEEGDPATSLKPVSRHGRMKFPSGQKSRNLLALAAN